MWSPIPRPGRCILDTDALTISGLNAFYGESHVLHDLSFSVKMGLVKANATRVDLFGQSISGLSPEAISLKGVGLVPQGRRVFPSLTVLENLTVAARRGKTGHSS